MSGLVAQYAQGTLTTPVEGASLDASVVVSNDNAVAGKHNSHDADATIHVQSSTLANRPSAGTAQRFWVTTDGLRAYVDSGSVWGELAYLSTASGGTVTGVVTFSAQPILSTLTASQAVFTDGSKGLVSNAVTGSGNVVMSASPTLTGTVVLTGTTITGTPTWSSSQAITLSTAAQPSITSVGTLTSLAVSGTTTVAVAGMTNSIKLAANTASTTYGIISFNGTLSSAGGLGFTAGGGVDKVLYAVAPTGGSYDWRINDVSSMTLSSAGALAVLAGISATTATFTAIPAESSSQNALCIINATGVVQQNSTTTCLVSSRRYKKDIAPLDPALALGIVERLEAVSYRDKETALPRFGLLAEDVDAAERAVMGKAYRGRLTGRGGDGKIASIHNEALVALLLSTLTSVRAVARQQQSQLTSLRKVVYGH